MTARIRQDGVFGIVFDRGHGCSRVKSTKRAVAAWLKMARVAASTLSGAGNGGEDDETRPRLIDALAGESVETVNIQAPELKISIEDKGD